MAIVKVTEDNIPEKDPKSSVISVSKPLSDTLTRDIPGLGTIISVRQEIDDALSDQRKFANADPDLVMMAVSSHSARLCELSIKISRVEVVYKEWRSVREEIDKIVSSLWNQYQIASRRQTIREHEYNTSR